MKTITLLMLINTCDFHHKVGFIFYPIYQDILYMIGKNKIISITGMTHMEEYKHEEMAALPQ